MKHTMIRIFSFITFCIITIGLQAQVEVVSPLEYNYELLRCAQEQPHTASKRKQLDTLQLPFIDDFSQQSEYPDSSRWLDREVFLNNTYPTNKISYGVATFDGLNEDGKPYAELYALPITDGYADTLTSQPINLATYGPMDSLYLRFAYEPQGLGDYPESIDSLFVEFKIGTDTSGNGIWRKVWGRAGFSNEIPNPQFVDAAILLDDAFYFTNNFQFRFRNRATIIGNNDHWHIDYVQLADNPQQVLTEIQDGAVRDEPTSILKNYTMMPWDQFQGYESQETVSDISFCFNNNYNTLLSSSFGYECKEKFTNTPIFSRPATSGNFTFLASSDTCITLPSSDIINNLPTLNNDSVIISTKVYINKQGSDITDENDTITSETKFFNLFAYDDGSAEMAYGLQGAGGLKKFAYRFHLNHPDTLRAILIHFTKINYDPSNELFSVYVWGNLDLNNTGTVTEDTVYSVDYQRAEYIDSIGGFAIFALDTPILVSDSIYVGWQQVTQNNISVGFDVNNDASANMYYYTSNQWSASAVSGAPMIRILVGSEVPLVGVEEHPTVKQTQALKVYPNPATDHLSLGGVNIQPNTQVEVWDVSGRRVLSQTISSVNESIETTQLNEGLYIVRVISENEVFTSRFIKQ